MTTGERKEPASMGDGPRYPQQQLRAVSIEAFFDGQLGSIAKMGEVQSAVRPQLSQLFVPHDVEGEAYWLRPFHLRDRIAHRSLAVAINQVTYVALKDYQGFESFAAEALPILETSLRILNVERLNRVVYRYSNAFIEPRAKGLDLRKIVGDTLPPWMTGGESDCELGWRGGNEDEFFDVRIFREVQDSRRFLCIENVAGVRNVTSSELASAAKNAHDAARARFESMICSDFRKFLSGDWRSIGGTK